MIRYFLLTTLLYAHSLFAQAIGQFDGNWAFTGLRTTIFKVQDNELFVGMLDYSDTANFNRFVQQLPVDQRVYKTARVSINNDTIFIHAEFTELDLKLNLVYLQNDKSHIWYTGDVFFDSAKVIVPNANCNLSSPSCINRLYNSTDLQSIQNLQSTNAFTRDDAFEFLVRLNGMLKLRCNTCYSGFTDAYINEVLIEMGYNPIVKRDILKSVWYNTSGFTSYIKTKFAKDDRILKLTNYIFDSYHHLFEQHSLPFRRLLNRAKLMEDSAFCEDLRKWNICKRSLIKSAAVV